LFLLHAGRNTTIHTFSNGATRLRRPSAIGMTVVAPRSCRGSAAGHYGSPEGRKQNSPGLQAWEAVPKENRPERAADYRALFRNITLVDSDEIAFRRECCGTIRREIFRAIKYNNNLSLRLHDPDSDAHPGRFHCAWVPRPEGLGCSVYALRAIRQRNASRNA
jgi:hypothetical protein